MAAIDGAIERAIRTMTTAGVSTQMATSVAWKAAREAVDDNVIDEARLFGTDRTLLEDLGESDSVRDIKDDHGQYRRNPQS